VGEVVAVTDTAMHLLVLAAQAQAVAVLGAGALFAVLMVEVVEPPSASPDPVEPVAVDAEPDWTLMA
jgi:hypothetical protein